MRPPTLQWTKKESFLKTGTFRSGDDENNTNTNEVIKINGCPIEHVETETFHPTIEPHHDSWLHPLSCRRCQARHSSSCRDLCGLTFSFDDIVSSPKPSAVGIARPAPPKLPKQRSKPRWRKKPEQETDQIQFE